MRGMQRGAVAAATVLALTVTAMASPVPVTLVSEDFDNLLGGLASAVGSPLTTDVSTGNMVAEVVSQTFTDGAGNYVYLYQVNNDGTATNSVVEVFTCSPFLGAANDVTLGYLTANAPSGFTLGDETPYAASVDAVAGPTISFAFPAFIVGEAIDPGEQSSTLYVLSTIEPGLITGNVINGETGSGDVPTKNSPDIHGVDDPSSQTLRSGLTFRARQE